MNHPSKSAMGENISLKSPNTQVVMAILLFVLSAVLAGTTEVGEWEASLFVAIHSWPIWLTPLFLIITQAGNVTVFFLLAAVYLIKKNFHLGLRLLMSGSLAYLLSGVAKDLLGRPRPSELLLEVVVRDWYVRGPGFPSGHTALATAIALVIGFHLPKKYRWVVPVMIVLVGLSRIYLGVHAPLDVVGGFAIGWGSYAIFRNVRLTDIHKKAKNFKSSSLKKRRKRHKLK